MHSWEFIIDNIFPLSTAEKLVRQSTPADIINEYTPTKIKKTYFLSFYKRKLIRAVIATAKFSHNQKSTTLLVILLQLWLIERKHQRILLLPIPLHPKRERQRGYNQVWTVLKKIKLNHVTVSKDVLIRNRNTIPQTSLNKQDRRHNLTGAFSVNIAKLNQFITTDNQLVIICDDVCTTGSTLKEATLALKPHLQKNCQLITLAWAH